MVLTGCPTTDQMIALIDGTLLANETADIQSHVDGCEACQRTLEGLVAGTASWDDAVNHLRNDCPPVTETILSDAIHQLKSDPQVAVQSTHNSANDLLDFLTPTDRPGCIGKLGTYEVSEVIGQGGMGVVLKAFDPSLHRVVAVKVLAPYLAHNPQARKRFIREAKAIAAVSHDHVITIHGIDDSIEQPNIVMQYIPGRSLQQKLDDEGSLELKEILRIGMQTAAGLAAAHAQGLVHRDVKPSNILLENSIQRVKLTDFGLARAVDDASVTQSGVIAGTPQYMAPEQANGDTVDSRADLFSLGSVLYAMCVGHSPFRASTTMGVLKRVCHDPPRPVRELNPDIPEWLSDIILKLLEKNPAERFATAKSVAELLEQWLAHVQQPLATPIPWKGGAVDGVANSSTSPLAPPGANNRSSAKAPEDLKFDPLLEAERVRKFSQYRRSTWIFLLISICIGMVMSQGAVAMGLSADFRIGAILGVVAFSPIALVRWIHASATGLNSSRRWSQRGADRSRFSRTTIVCCLICLIAGPLQAVAVSRWRGQSVADLSPLAGSLVGLIMGLCGCLVIIVCRYILLKQFKPRAVDQAGSPQHDAQSNLKPAMAPGAAQFRSPLTTFKPISYRWMFYCVGIGSMIGGMAGVVQLFDANPYGIQDPWEPMIIGSLSGLGVFLIVSLIRLEFTELKEAMFFAVDGLAFPSTSALKARVGKAADALRKTAAAAVGKTHHIASAVYTASSMVVQKDGRSELRRNVGMHAKSSIAAVLNSPRHNVDELISVGWCLAGGLDFLQWVSALGKYVVWDILGLTITVVSFLILHCIRVRQNPDLIRTLSIVAVWPFSIGAIVRIPLVIGSRLWLRSPTVCDSFSDAPWRETQLGRPIHKYVSPMIRWAGRLSLRSAVTLGSLAIWTFACYWILFGLFLVEMVPTWDSVYRINDITTVVMREHPEVRFTMSAIGMGNAKGLAPAARTCVRQQLKFSRPGEPASRSFAVNLGDIPTVDATGTVLNKSQFQGFFMTFFGKPFPEQADSLLKSILQLNEDERKTGKATPGLSWADRLRFVQRALNPPKNIGYDHRVPFVGYTRAGIALDPREFDAMPDFEHSAFSCNFSTHSIIKGVISAAVLWLSGVLLILILRRRQRIQTESTTKPNST